MNFKYKYGVLGGTFDHFHIGHQKLIDKAYVNAEKITIGITKEEFNKNKFLSGTIEKYEVRKKTVKKYLKKNELIERTTFIPIKNIYGNTLTDKNIQVIFITKKNSKNVQIINKKRKELGLSKLQIIEVDLARDEFGKIVSSERIRYGEIDRNGHSYEKIFFGKKISFMPQSLICDLRKPAGEIIKKLPVKINSPLIIAVGDITTATLIKNKIVPNISIIDFKTQRKPVKEKKLLFKIISKNKTLSKNQSGTVNSLAVNVFRKVLKKYFKTRERQAIAIEGEEDLLVLPIILFAPLGSFVTYGLKDAGMILIKITEGRKKFAENILKKFN